MKHPNSQYIFHKTNIGSVKNMAILDFSKAFEVLHQRLSSNLEFYGIQNDTRR